VIKYKHVRQVDEFVGDVRVTRDASTNVPSRSGLFWLNLTVCLFLFLLFVSRQAVLQAVHKTRLGNLDIVMPGHPFDVRLSLSREEPVPLTALNPHAPVQKSRKKVPRSCRLRVRDCPAALRCVSLSPP
jgi:hypothetical protein